MEPWIKHIRRKRPRAHAQAQKLGRGVQAVPRFFGSKC